MLKQNNTKYCMMLYHNGFSNLCNTGIQLTGSSWFDHNNIFSILWICKNVLRTEVH